MKSVFISGALFFSFVSCFAQLDKKGILEISAGGAFSIGEFGYTRFDYEESGFAKNGIALALSFNYRLKAHLGLVASVSEYILGVDESNVAKKYWVPGTGWNSIVEAANWMSNAYMGGIDIILPVYRSDFYFRLLGGLARTRLPGLTGRELNFHREATTDIAAAWSVGAGIAYQYFDRITLSLRLDFFMTHPALDEIWTSDFGSGSGKIYQNISMVNLTAGLGFKIF